jgi:hypothetical protein
MGVAMHFEGAGGDGRARFAPAHHHVVAAVLLVDRRFAAAVVRRGGQRCAGDARMRPLGPSPIQPVTTNTTACMPYFCRIGCAYPVVQVAIVEGDHDRLARHRLAGQEAGVLVQCQRGPAVAGQPGDLAFEILR